MLSGWVRVRYLSCKLAIHSGTGIKVLQWDVSTKITPVPWKAASAGELYIIKLYSMPFMIQPSSMHGRRRALRYAMWQQFLSAPSMSQLWLPPAVLYSGGAFTNRTSWCGQMWLRWVKSFSKSHPWFSTVGAVQTECKVHPTGLLLWWCSHLVINTRGSSMESTEAEAAGGGLTWVLLWVEDKTQKLIGQIVYS